LLFLFGAPSAARPSIEDDQITSQARGGKIGDELPARPAGRDLASRRTV